MNTDSRPGPVAATPAGSLDSPASNTGSPARTVDPVHALIVVDMQSAFVTGADTVPHAATVLARTEQLIAKARAADALVVQLQNDGPEGASDEVGTPGWEVHVPVDTERGEILLRKTVDDGFEETDLEELLRSRGVTALAVCGVMSEMCVSATARTARDLEFRVVLPHDAHGTHDIPAAPGISDAVPAATVSRVAEWALGDEVEIVPSADDVSFVAP
ncbi:isochorismatase family protein [Streptomyces sp. p1417]|uniref:Isochorismatase family protein n=1 Tax=Streptomyces typhae TaxID=2681492 RepID=A0A6L6X311_9ACTN|nr:cysteine hydrolase family protein [Streptomyces typhae]MVO88195.1 isochorismatase family protein [Streptomyces typhae]